MKITRRQIRKIIKETLLLETEMLPIIVNPYEDLETMNRVANYALTNDIAGALADDMVNYENLDLDLDEMRGWVNKVGKKPDYFSEEAVVPDNWDIDKVYKFMGDLEDAWIKKKGAASDSKHQSDPGVEEREVIGNSLTMDYIDFDELKNVTYQIRRKGGEPANINLEYNDDGARDFGNISADQVRRAGLSMEDVIKILSDGGAKEQKKSPSVKPTPQMYD